MSGGIVGGEWDPHDEGIYEALVLRQDSTMELYQRDTLLCKSSFRIVLGDSKLEKNSIMELEITDDNGSCRGHVLSFKDANHLWYWLPNSADNIDLFFVRHD